MFEDELAMMEGIEEEMMVQDEEEVLGTPIFLMSIKDSAKKLHYCSV